tara:strand:+ start:122 stop:1000 length:879 start_codon:yes stop_codon:yes gene_type:complete
MIKSLTLFLLVLITSASFAQNTIIAIVNDDFISSNQIKPRLLKTYSKTTKIELINKEIDMMLQLQKVKELNLKPNEIEVNKSLFKIANDNGLSIDTLRDFGQTASIKKDISEQLSILSLQRFITKDIYPSKINIMENCPKKNLKNDQKQIKIAQIIISEIDTSFKDSLEKKYLIKSFLKKLSILISNGASFEAIAKLHSQHPSYKDGGVTEWLTINNPTLEMLDSLNINEVSEIYSTDFGFAIGIKIGEQYISSKLKECTEQLIYKNAESYYASWLKSLRDEAFIEIYYDKL